MQAKNHLWPSLFESVSFFVRFKWPFLRPGLLPGRRRAQGLSRRPSGPAKRLGLDGFEHGALTRQTTAAASESTFALARVHGIYRDPGGFLTTSFSSSRLMDPIAVLSEKAEAIPPSQRGLSYKLFFCGKYRHIKLGSRL